jgi:prepilin-type N-terminal cleavage/methylation domain-containing protein
MKVVNDMHRTYLIGFTLAELLIALTILGEIAAFTIPKIISSQQNGQKRAVTKEMIAMFSAAYQLA